MYIPSEEFKECINKFYFMKIFIENAKKKNTVNWKESVVNWKTMLSNANFFLNRFRQNQIKWRDKKMKEHFYEIYLIHFKRCSKFLPYLFQTPRFFLNNNFDWALSLLPSFPSTYNFDHMNYCVVFRLIFVVVISTCFDMINLL